jgi:hypothetical protein
LNGGFEQAENLLQMKTAYSGEIRGNSGEGRVHSGAGSPNQEQEVRIRSNKFEFTLQKFE